MPLSSRHYSLISGAQGEHEDEAIDTIRMAHLRMAHLRMDVHFTSTDPGVWIERWSCRTPSNPGFLRAPWR